MRRGHAGQQAARSLRVKQQGVAGVAHEFIGVAQGAAQAHIGRLQRADDARLDAVHRTVQQGQGAHGQFGVHTRWPCHLDQVAQQAKTGQIGAGGRAVVVQNFGAHLVGQHHRLQCRSDPAPLGRIACVRGEQGAGPHRLGQQQHIARLHAALAHHAVHLFIDQAVDGKAQGQLCPFARVPAHQGAACGVQHLDGATHHLGQQVFDFALQAWGHGDHGGGRLWLGPHGKNITQRVVGGHLAEQIGVVDEGPEKVHRLHHGHARRHAHHGRIVGRVQADQYIWPLDRMQAAQCPGQNVGAYFGAAAPAAHGDGRNGLQ